MLGDEVVHKVNQHWRFAFATWGYPQIGGSSDPELQSHPAINPSLAIGQRVTRAASRVNPKIPPWSGRRLVRCALQRSVPAGQGTACPRRLPDVRRTAVRHLLAACTAMGLAAGCSPPPRPPAAALPAARPDGSEEGAARNLKLDIFTTSVLTDGQTAHIRGRVKNRLPSRVEGIRFVVTIYPPDSLQPLDAIRTEAATVLEPNAEAPLRLDLQSLYFGSSRFRFTILAVPVKLGGQEVPPP